ncbi:MAG: PD-(D/E)XK nuclease family protein [Oscillospiraceae bacterium]
MYHYEQLSQLPKKLTVTQIAKSSNARTITTQKVTPRFLSSSEMTPSQKGLALHAFMQYADFSNAKISVKDEINRLFENRFISKSQADSINVKKIEAFLQSGLFNRIMNASKVYKEYKFNYEIDAGEVFSGIAGEFKDEKILIQGIADCIIVEENMITIIDYKTDYESSQQVLINRYQNQLQIYKQALQQELQMPVRECLLYSTHLETQISVSANN